MSRPIKTKTLIRRNLYISCGLSDKEAQIYDLLLSYGTLSGAMLEKLSKLKKNTYALLRSLQGKHLVNQIKSHGKIVFQPAAPAELLNLVKKKEADIFQTKSSLETILPELNSNYQEAVGKPVVSYFEGQKGLQEVFKDIYDPKNSQVHGCVDLEIVDQVFPDHILDTLIPHRQKYNIKAWALIADSTKSRKIAALDNLQLRKSVLFDKNKYPLPAEIEVYQNKVALMSFAKNKFIALIIENPDFAVTLRSIMQWVIDHRDLTVSH